MINLKYPNAIYYVSKKTGATYVYWFDPITRSRYLKCIEIITICA